MNRIKNFDQFLYEELNIDSSVKSLPSGSPVKEILSKLTSIPVFGRVKNCYSPTPEYFVENLKKEFPEIGPKSAELLGKMKSVLKMDKSDRIQYLSKNWKKMISGDLSESETLYEALPPNVIATIILGVAIILIIILSPAPGTEPKPIKIITVSPETTELGKLFKGKTINFYNDPDQRMLWGKLKISDIGWENNGEIQWVTMIGYDHYSSKVFYPFAIKGLLNPPSVDNRIIQYKDLKISSDREFGLAVDKETPISTHYNKSFTDELNRIATPWIKKPEADYSKKGTK